MNISSPSLLALAVSRGQQRSSAKVRGVTLAWRLHKLQLSPANRAERSTSGPASHPRSVWSLWRSNQEPRRLQVSDGAEGHSSREDQPSRRRRRRRRQEIEEEREGGAEREEEEEYQSAGFRSDRNPNSKITSKKSVFVRDDWL